MENIEIKENIEKDIESVKHLIHLNRELYIEEAKQLLDCIGNILSAKSGLSKLFSINDTVSKEFDIVLDNIIYFSKKTESVFNELEQAEKEAYANYRNCFEELYLNHEKTVTLIKEKIKSVSEISFPAISFPEIKIPHNWREAFELFDRFYEMPKEKRESFMSFFGKIMNVETN